MTVYDRLDERLPELVADALEGVQVARCGLAEAVVDVADIARPQPVRVFIAVGVLGC